MLAQTSAHALKVQLFCLRRNLCSRRMMRPYADAKCVPQFPLQGNIIRKISYRHQRSCHVETSKILNCSAVADPRYHFVVNLHKLRFVRVRLERIATTTAPLHGLPMEQGLRRSLSRYITYVICNVIDLYIANMFCILLKKVQGPAAFPGT